MKKYILPIVALLCMTVVSCSDDEYTAGPQSQGAYFDNATPTTCYFDTEETSVAVVINRTDVGEAQTIGLTSVDESGLFNVPEVAYFAADAATAVVNITFDPTQLKMNDYPVVIKINEDEAYQYGATELEFTLGFLPALRWEDYGVALYRDDLVTTFFSLGGFPEYEVPIQRHMTTSGLYRLVSPYGACYPFNEPGDYAEGDFYMEIHAEDPNAVYVSQTHTGMDWGYGEFIMWSYADYYMKKGYSLATVAANGFCGKMVNGVITMPASSMLIAMLDYNNGGLYDSNLNGMFRVVLPGASVPAE